MLAAGEAGLWTSAHSRVPVSNTRPAGRVRPTTTVNYDPVALWYPSPVVPQLCGTPALWYPSAVKRSHPDIKACQSVPTKTNTAQREAPGPSEVPVRPDGRHASACERRHAPPAPG
ncbi:hypothetical protein EYF80_028768 [Liparis tanakae]|uniref:Uncharacterized protein n=1 Tax=Liparis tanakae TaxID=230148 RepID=A0A4Z2H647_9TELE|nr:hypothetical protein EYF80_028768 [Liparis tanakae]